MQRRQKRDAEDQIILELVRAVRRRHPQMGVRKLHHELNVQLIGLGINRGRDALFTLLKAHNMLVRTKPNRRRTTHAGLWRCSNLLQDTQISYVHQAWVGDITYLATETGFVYLALLTDAFSRFIVGFDVSTSLALEGCLRALNHAIDSCSQQHLSGLIHHTDHGVQYSSWPYRERLQTLRIRSSMGQVGNCYDNALAERMNGILKCEYGLSDLFVNTEHAILAVQQAVYLYNFERPHLALAYAKPADIFFNR